MAEHTNDVNLDGVKHLDKMVRDNPAHGKDDREGAVHVGARDEGRGHRRRPSTPSARTSSRGRDAS